MNPFGKRLAALILLCLSLAGCAAPGGSEAAEGAESETQPDIALL